MTFYNKTKLKYNFKGITSQSFVQTLEAYRIGCVGHNAETQLILH